MKYFYTFTLLLLSHLGLGQITSDLGIYDIDSCNFEISTLDLEIDTSSQNLWQIGVPNKPFFDTAYSAPNAIFTDSINPYASDVNCYFDVIIPNDTYGMNKIISFKHKYETDTLVDGGYIEVSYDMGQNWNNVIHDDTVHSVEYLGFENMYSENDTLKDNHFGFSGTSEEWITTRIQWVWALPIKSSIPDTIIVRFNFISDNMQTNKAGWMIDDIVISYGEFFGSVEEYDNQNAYEFFPNPMDNHATIQFNNPDQSDCQLVIFDQTGRIVRSNDKTRTNEFKFGRDELNSGIYYFQIRSTKSILSKGKFIIE